MDASQPVMIAKSDAAVNAGALPSPSAPSSTMGATIVTPSAAMTRPITYPTGRRSTMMAEGWPQPAALSSAQTGCRSGRMRAARRKRLQSSPPSARCREGDDLSAQSEQ